jgi:DNA-binding NtrC family response regulator/tetratricopeptide (TPR) repeat protein
MQGGTPMQTTVAAIFDLIERGHYQEATAALNELRSALPEHQALRQLIEVDTGDPETADESARALLKRQLTNRERVLCLLVTGRASSLAGRFEEGCAALRLAVSVASACNDLTLVARTEARLTKQLLRGLGIEAGTAEIPHLRKSAHLAGDRRAVADFHCVVAEIEMKRRNYLLALKHLQLAEDVSADLSDLSMTAQIGRLKANVALMAAEPRTAVKRILPTIKIVEQMGVKSSLMASLSTLAECYLIGGAFSDAEAVLKRMARLTDSKGSHLTTLDSLMLAALGQGSIALASEFLMKVDALGGFPAGHYSWLWHITTRAKLLLALGRPAEALSILREHRRIALKTSDERLIARFLLLESELLIESGTAYEAAVNLAIAAITLATLTPEDLVQIYRIASLMSETDCENFTNRADRIRTIALSPQALSYPITVPRETVGAPTSLLHSAAVLFSAPLHAEVMAHETASLLYTSGAADTVSISTSNQQQAAPVTLVGEESTMHVLIDICDQAKNHYLLNVRPRSDPEAWLSLAAIQTLVRSAMALAESQLRDRLEPSVWPDTLVDEQNGMIVAAPSMTELLTVTRRVATSSVTVLFTGETGTGKELLARALHDASPRREKPFVPFNCAAVARDMLDSQLFGYRRGAFTGAQEAFQGIVRAAEGGTLFLDEIGEMPTDVQPKLLRFLESGEIHPLGEPRPIAVDLRVVAATNAHLEQLVADGRFREDLFYRLNVVRLQVPPLRERREEIPLIAQHYVDLFSRDSQKTRLRLAEETMEYLVLYNWPGNVRQLANEIRRMVAIAESGAVLMPEHLSHEIASSRRTIPASQRDIAPTEFVVRMDQPMSAAIEHLERSMIQYAMLFAEGRQEEAAQILGLSRKGLYLKRLRLKMLSPSSSEDEEGNAEKTG